MKNRRVFLLQSVVATSASAWGLAIAATNPLLDDQGPKAKVMGYVNDTAKADQVKYPKHEATQMCSNCALWQGKAGEAAGACPLYPGNQTASKGWCNAYAKKA